MNRAHQTILVLMILSALPAAGQSLAVTHYKYQNTLRVAAQVSHTFNDLRQTPKLVMPRGKFGQIAKLSLEPEIQLVIDEKLYDLCRETGKDSLAALAFIISHELTHFFYTHRHPFGFASAQKDLNERDKEIEKEADLYGLINGFAAGYSTFTIARPILEKIYRAYNLPDSLVGYPSRQERLQAIASLGSQAQQMASVFEVGKFLYLKGEYAASAHCFSNLASQVPAKEFFNNLGSAQLQQVLSSGWVKSMPFKLPVEIDANNRLLGQTRKGSANQDSESQTLLESAVRNFEKALLLDRDYVSANINLATSQLLLNRNGTVIETLDRLSFNISSLSPNLALIKAIALFRSGKYEDAEAILKKAKGAFELDYNKKTMILLRAGATEKEIAEKTTESVLTSTSSSAIAGGVETSLKGLTLPLPGDMHFDFEQNLPKPDLIHFQFGVQDGAYFYRVLIKDGTFNVIQGFQQAKEPKTARGIVTGDSVEKLRSKYGAPTRLTGFSNGSYYCYDKAQIYFKVCDNRVENWLIYQKVISPD